MQWIHQCTDIGVGVMRESYVQQTIFAMRLTPTPDDNHRWPCKMVDPLRLIYPAQPLKPLH